METSGFLGEIAQEFEDGELISIEASWKAGVNGAKAEILMEADPWRGDVYRQEFALGDAEDMAEVLSLEASPEPDVTEKDYRCIGECLQTKDFTPLEPDVIEYKYYKRDIGVVLEEDPETGERVELVEFSTP